MIEIEVTRRIAASPEPIWDTYTDWPGWSQWSGLGQVRLTRAGEHHAMGVGAIRGITNFGFEVLEEIVAFERPRHVQYRVIGEGLPMAEHLGEWSLERDGDHTLVRWGCHFRPTLPGISLLMRGVVTATFTHVLRQLDRRLRAAQS